MLEQVHVPQHHQRGQQQRRRVGQPLASNVRCGPVDGLEDRSVLSNVTRGGQTETSDQTGTHIRENVTVKVGHDHDRVGVRGRVLYDPETDPVEEVLVVDDVGVVLGHVPAGFEEHAVGHFHDGGLVHGGDLVSAVLRGVVEGVSGDSLGGLVGDQLDGLDDTGDELGVKGGGSRCEPRGRPSCF